MDFKNEIKILGWITVVFVFVFFMPLESARFKEAIMAMFDLSKWYAQEHVILCLLPAFFIAGVISVFVSQGAVMKYFGAKAKKWVAYTVASGRRPTRGRRAIPRSGSRRRRARSRAHRGRRCRASG